MGRLTRALVWLNWWWRTRHCRHPPQRLRRIGGDERMTYGYRWRCLDCGKPLKET